MKTIKNRAEVIEQLTDMLMQYDKDLRDYQVDIYLYYDKDSQTAELDTFTNVGGNSWRNDDGEVIHHCFANSRDWTDYFTEVGDIADGLDIPCDQLLDETAEYAGLNIADTDEEDSVEYIDVWYYIDSRADYTDKLIEFYKASIDKDKPYYADEAERIISDWESERI